MSEPDPDAQYMDRVLALSWQQLTSCDVPIAALITDPSGQIIAEGVNSRECSGDPTAHAEINAIKQAATYSDGWRLTGCTLYVTVEPCTMCAGAINLARISRVVFGAFEPKTGAVGSLWDALRDPRLAHTTAVRSLYRAEESSAILRQYFLRLRNKKQE